ncbi:hypothetical protein SDC9_136706 [bioreactor metagenome]|uniref:Uncharacterized protein n=1 Tax=bioreactor metagenome TaxID=1076179 RepID=A0A645DJG1_9ZZZZ
MLVSSAISFTDIIPLSSAWKMTKRRSLVGVLRRVLISGSSQRFIPSWLSISRDLKAFRRDSSIVLPIAMISPVLFMAVVRVLSAVVNLSKGHLGIFVIT